MKDNDKAYYRSLGDQLRRAREAKKMSLQQLSDAIGSKKSRQTIMRYELGQSRIPNDEFNAICNVLGLDPAEVDTTAKWSALITSQGKDRVDYLIRTDKGDIFAEVLVRQYQKADDATRQVVRRLLEIHE